jgi:hypothetical protein
MSIFKKILQKFQSKSKVEDAKEEFFDDLFLDINKSKPLFKELSRKCHPDKFIDPVKKQKAESIYKEITEHKHNYNMLIQLKQRATEELDIKN